MKIVIDAGVIARWVLSGPDSDLALGLREYDIMVPDLAFAELSAMLAQRVAQGEMSAEDAASALQFLMAANPVSIPSRDLAQDALAMACALKHPAFDLFYVALARKQGLKLAMTDDALIAKIRALDPQPAWAALILPLEEFQPGALTPSPLA